MENTRKPEIKIITDGKKSEIFVDGKKLEGVIGYKVVHSTKDEHALPRLQIDLRATNVTLDADMIPALPEPFSSFYVSKHKLIESGVVTQEQIELM